MKKFYLILILFFALVLRVSGIRFGLPSKNLALTTYNPDEPLSYYTIEKWNPKKLDFHPHRAFLWGGFHLYPLAGSLGLAKIIGYVKFGSREFYIKNLKEADKLYFVGRFLMTLFSVGSISLIFLICKEAYNELTGLLSAFLLTITPTHIFSSIYVRPDIMMLFFALGSLYFAVRLLKFGQTKFYILSSIFVGLATGTKLSGAVYGITPIIAHFLSDRNLKEKFKDPRLSFIPIICLISFCISSPYVIIDFNKTSESFLSYFKQNLTLVRGTMDFGQYALYGTGIISYLKHYLLYGLGKVIVITAIIGLLLMLFNIVKNKNKFDMLFFISGLVILFTISSTKNQTVWYSFPVIPFFIIYSMRGFDLNSKFKIRIISILVTVALIIMFSYTLFYSLAYLRLYVGKNVREEASEWIEKNIPKGSEIAIAAVISGHREYCVNITHRINF